MAIKRQDTLAAAPPFAAFGKTHENETHTTENQSAQIIRVWPVPAVKARLDENRAPTSGTRNAPNSNFRKLTSDGGAGIRPIRVRL
jgi:hypothetical protein